MQKEKRLLFSVTADDCIFSYTKGSGPGGQKKNKTSSAVHCTHKDSGAKGYSEASRSQYDNKKDAFLKMIDTPVFKKWHRIEVLKKTGEMEKIDKYVEEQMKLVKIEMNNDGKWVDWCDKENKIKE